MNRHDCAGLALFTFSLLDRVDGLVAAVSSRSGGVSAAPFDSLNLGLRVADDRGRVIENRRRFANAAGFDLADVVATCQVHGAVVRVVGAKDRGVPAGRDESWACDGLVTRERGVVLMGFSADCPLVLLADPASEVIGLVHCGWRSTVAGVVANAIAECRALGADPSRVVAGISPGIGPCCYEVGSEVKAAAASTFGDVERFFRPHRPEKFFLDLPSLVGHAIEREGVGSSNVESADLCTRCRQDLFYSHRGSGGRTGRMAAVIGYTSPR